MTRRALAVFLLALVAIAVFATPAVAHNTLVSSDPADGAVLEVTPTQVTFVFDRPVPLDTVTVTFVDASGTRNELSQIRHGSSGDTEVVAELPAASESGGTLRWRLVGPDGHPITGRVQFSITGAPEVSAAPVADEPEPWSASDPVRWMLRFASYLAIAVAGGIATTSVLVWADALTHPLLRRIVAVALSVIGVGALAQLLIIAGDISGSPPWSALGDVGGALKTDAGRAFLTRGALTAALAVLLFKPNRLTETVRNYLTVVLLVGMLVTWAYAGHSKSMRLPWVGVPLDVAHHAAVIVWLGGLAVVGLIAGRQPDIPAAARAVTRFGSIAAISVAVIVATGLAQTLRLVGSPLAIWSADHGRLLILKVLILLAMLKIADLNRRRVARHFDPVEATRPRATQAISRAMVTELAVGLIVMAITAVMVVSPPASAQQADQASASVRATDNDD